MFNWLAIGLSKINHIHGRPRRIWEYNIKMDPKEIGLEGVD
jgi:hypothetical protein